MYRVPKAMLVLALAMPLAAHAVGRPQYVQTTAGAGGFPLVAGGESASVHVSHADWPGVIRAAGDLADDIKRVTGIAPPLVESADGSTDTVVLIGTLGRSPLIDELAAANRIDVSNVAGRWESFVLQTVTDPLPGVARALVIAGSDKRGTIYGIYDLSEQIGVSPWYWWADAVPEHKDELHVRDGRYVQGEPSVKYRGIFLNDERPDLDRWVRATYGERPDPSDKEATVANFNSDFYARIFEVILRLKGNYLWPAMWNNAFAEDDPENARLADLYGIVMGTSHQEPMMRAQKEWDWHLRPRYGDWNFAKHPDALTTFWREGVRARGTFENLYTIGLRGENDTEMVHTTEESIRLLQHIVGIQRDILRDEVNPDISSVPQVWTLYKEVQGYYENGLRVPDDVTLLWADDNWGNLRRLPTAGELQRTGGAGVYYHFDYHGGPRSYQWINTNPLAKIWDQMSLAKQYGADRIWIVNVGHFKGYELPTEYFLDLAWDTERWQNDNIAEYMRLWAAREFGVANAAAIADMLARYTKYNGRRKPELLEADTYSLVQDREWERVVADYKDVVDRAETMYARLPEHKRDAFYELVLLPARASAIVNEMYYAAARNALYAKQGRAATNRMAERTRELFRADAELTQHFNDELAGGKWKHFMDQPHIGYTSWRDPPANNLDAITLKELKLPRRAGLGVAVEGVTRAWPDATAGTLSLPMLDVFGYSRSYIDIYNRGRTPFEYFASADKPWIVLGNTAGRVGDQARLWVTLDKKQLPKGTSQGTVTIAGAGNTVPVNITAFNPRAVRPGSLRGHAESRGIVSIEPEHYSANDDGVAGRWIPIEDYGHTLSGMRAEGRPHAPAATPGVDAPHLDYRMYLFTPGEVSVALSLSPTLNFMPDRGLRLAVSFDDDEPRIVNILPQGNLAPKNNPAWARSVMNNVRRVRSSHTITAPGYHTLKVWMVDPAVLVQKIVVTTSSAAPLATYLGPPESYRH